MTKGKNVELCNCPAVHYRSMDGHCIEPSVRSEFPRRLVDLSQCGCCMADCPDVHAEPDAEFLAVPGAVLVAEEYILTLHKLRQKDLREQASRGELRIVPRTELARRCEEMG